MQKALAGVLTFLTLPIPEMHWWCLRGNQHLSFYVGPKHSETPMSAVRFLVRSYLPSAQLLLGSHQLNEKWQMKYPEAVKSL